MDLSTHSVLRNVTAQDVFYKKLVRYFILRIILFQILQFC
jgi:hypothetical protein